MHASPWSRKENRRWDALCPAPIDRRYSIVKNRKGENSTLIKSVLKGDLFRTVHTIQGAKDVLHFIVELLSYQG